MPHTNAATKLAHDAATNHAERRRCERIPAVRYTAMLSKRSGFMVRKPIETAVDNFNRSGMTVHSEKRFKIGEQINIELLSANEKISGLVGVVRNVVKDHLDYRYGVEFVDATSGESTQNVLNCLEQVIKAQAA